MGGTDWTKALRQDPPGAFKDSRGVCSQCRVSKEKGNRRGSQRCWTGHCKDFGFYAACDGQPLDNWSRAVTWSDLLKG